MSQDYHGLIEQIELSAERMMDRLDRLFLSSPMTQEEYDARVRNVNAWVEQQYTKL